MRVLLGVSAGIAAYKVAYVVRGLTEHGHDVQVIPTADSLQFVGAATWEALSGHPVHTSVFDDVPGVEHVRSGQQADLVIVAPATADLLARAAHGQANDLLTASLLMATCPVLLVPAMHTQMWEHPATIANVATLRSRGVHVMEPATGRLTGVDSGPGRLPEPEEILAAATELMATSSSEPETAVSRDQQPQGRTATGATPSYQPQDLAGVKVLISAGGTRERIDPVRYIGNRSSGRQGWALARVAQARGAHVTLVAANVTLPAPDGVQVRAVETGAELHAAMSELAPSSDVVVMVAAVADFRPVSMAEHKIKKTGADLTLELTPTTDILAELVQQRRAGQTIIGFGAETGDDAASVTEHGRAKARRKGADLLVVNPVSDGAGFGDVPNSVTMFNAAGEVLGTAAGSKDEVAAAIWDQVAGLRR